MSVSLFSIITLCSLRYPFEASNYGFNADRMVRNMSTALPTVGTSFTIISLLPDISFKLQRRGLLPI